MNEGETFELNSWNDARPGRWLKHGHLCGEVRTLTVKNAWGECMGRDKKTGKDIITGIFSFEETELHYALPRAVEVCVVDMFGAKPSGAIGKRIAFKVDKDRFGKDIVDCIRVAGSPDIPEPIKSVVKYAAKTGRPDKTFLLAITDAPMGLPGKEPPAPPPTAEQLEQALGAISGATAESLEPVLTSLREHAWTPEQTREIKAAIAAVKGA